MSSVRSSRGTPKRINSTATDDGESSHASSTLSTRTSTRSRRNSDTRSSDATNTHNSNSQFADVVKRLEAVPSFYHTEDYNPLPVVVQILKSQKSDELEEHLDELRRHSASLDECMQQLVDAYFQGFNRSIRSYSDVLACVSAAQRAVKQQHSDLEHSSKLVNPAVRLSQLRTLWKRASEHAIVYDLLDRVEQLRDAPPQIDQLLSRRLYVRATQLLVDAMAAMFGDDLRDVTALIALQATMLQLKQRAFDNLLDELRVFLYADADAVERMTRVRRAVDAHIADRAQMLADEEKKRKQLPTAAANSTGINAQSTMPATWHPPYRANDVPLPPDPEEAFVCIIVDSLANLDRISTALSTLVSSMPGQFRYVIDRATEAAARFHANSDGQNSAQAGVLPFIDATAAVPLTGRPTKTRTAGVDSNAANAEVSLGDSTRPPSLVHLHAPRSARALYDAIWRQLRQFEALFRRNLLMVRALCTRPLQRSVDQLQDDVLIGRRNPALQSYTPQRILDVMEGEIYAFLMLHMAPPVKAETMTVTPAHESRDDESDSAANSDSETASGETRLVPIVMPVFRFADSGASSRLLMEVTQSQPAAPALTAGADALEAASSSTVGGASVLEVAAPGAAGSIAEFSSWHSVFEPSPHNVAYAYPLVSRFARSVSRIARYLAEGDIQVTLQLRLDRFVRDAFMPHIEFDYIEQLSTAFSSPDGLKPRSLVGTPLVVPVSSTPYTGRGEPRVVMRVALDAYSLIYRMWGSVLSLPTRLLRPLVAVLEDTVVAFEARLRERVNEVLRPRVGESSVATMMRDPRLAPLLLSDPLYRTTQQVDESRANLVDGGSSFSAPDLDADADRAFRAAEENLEEPLYDTFVINARQLLDSERMGQLAIIGDSCNWFASQLRALATQLRTVRGNDSDADAPTEDDTQSEVDDETSESVSVSASVSVSSAASRRRADEAALMRRSSTQVPARSSVCEAICKTLQQLASQLDDLSQTSLFSLRTELRLHLFYHLDFVKKASYEISDDQDPDPFISVLNDDLREAERAISSCMPPRHCRYLFYRLPGHVCNILMRALGKKITAINRAGVLKMHKNLFLLQRALAVGAAASDAYFERVRLYYELTLLSAQELVDYARDHADNSRGRFTYQQYRALLVSTKKWPLSERQNAALMRCGQ